MADSSGSTGAGAVDTHHPPPAPTGKYLVALSVAALGVVYGDIGTSPLYALREAFHHSHGVEPSAANVLGVLSLIFWALVCIICIKYLTFVLRADNRGEGGILALTSLVTPMGGKSGGRRVLILLGLFGTSLLYGDGMITPAISVLSAVEGLQLATPVFEPYIVPITIAIIIGIFSLQRRGTAGIGRLFGPLTLVWFATIGVLGVRWIVHEPHVLGAINPLHGARFFLHNGWNAFLVLGSVILVVTGGEALYADMGHFGRRPIRVAWFTVALPALLLNYFGQGALLLEMPRAIDNPFFHMPPSWALLPVVGIATLATCIASQALISGAFSLTKQAVQLGYVPRMEIRHTSEQQSGQIYIPTVNRVLMVACIGLVLGFRSSSNLAAAYGIATTTTMVVTTLLFSVVLRERWKWAMPAALALSAFFLVIDLAFWSANIIKVAHGGWVPLAIGAVIFTLMTTWKKGRILLSARLHARTLPHELFVQEVLRKPPLRVPGTAVFMYSNPSGTPPALLHSLKHYKALHETVVYLSVQTRDQPFVEMEERAEVVELGGGIYQVVLRYGFMETADIPRDLGAIRIGGHKIRTMETTYFLGRETLITSRKYRGMALWRERLFAIMARNARSAGSFFQLPPNRVVEIGAQIEL